MSMLLVQKNRAQTLVEFALVLPLILLIAIFIFDFGRAVFYYSVIYNAAREGARYGAIRQSLDRTSTIVTDYTGIINAARHHVYGIPPEDVDVEAYKFLVAPNNQVETIDVLTRYCYKPVTPFLTQLLGTGCVDLESTSKMFLER